MGTVFMFPPTYIEFQENIHKYINFIKKKCTKVIRTKAA